MSKTTKIIAALGVVAGLGVAALPAFTFATENVTGDVEVLVKVEPAIAMTISGNNDDGSEGTTVYYSVVTPAGSENPSELGWYERTGEAGSYSYTESSDDTVVSGKTYCTQTTVTRQAVDNAAPASAAGKTLDGHTIPATLVAGTSSSYASLLPNSTETGNGTNNFRSTITVYTNAASGYGLTLKDKDTDNALVNVSGATIPATASTSLTAGTPAWGYKVYSTGGNHEGTGATPTGDTDWLAVPVSTGTAAIISGKDSKTSGGDQTIVDYGVATAADQATGIYGDIIVYTATTNN